MPAAMADWAAMPPAIDSVRGEIDEVRLVRTAGAVARLETDLDGFGVE